MQSPRMRSQRWRTWAIGAGLLMVVGALLNEQRQRTTPHLSRRVARRLPLAKHLRTIPDQLGNYDLDGVSYDVEGVIVGGDADKPPPPI